VERAPGGVHDNDVALAHEEKQPFELRPLHVLARRPRTTGHGDPIKRRRAQPANTTFVALTIAPTNVVERLSRPSHRLERRKISFRSARTGSDLVCSRVLLSRPFRGAGWDSSTRLGGFRSASPAWKQTLANHLG
jgi:hypothetical protein